MSELLIKDQNIIDNFIQAMKNDGASRLHVLADFDRTLMKGIVNGKPVPSIISILRDENFLTPDYPAKAHELFDKYHPIELDPSIGIEQKKEAMLEWWTAHFELLIKSGLSKKDLEQVIKSANLQMREGAWELMEILAQKQIPLVIMSASGLGKEVIELYLESIGLMKPSVYIISNQFEWDQDGKISGFRLPIVHGMNKDETLLKNSPIFDKIKERKNVILIGDSLGDVGMIEGFEYDNLLKIGFLDEEIEKRRGHYQESFDVVIESQGGFEFLNDMLKKMES